MTLGAGLDQVREAQVPVDPPEPLPAVTVRNATTRPVVLVVLVAVLVVVQSVRVLATRLAATPSAAAEGGEGRSRPGRVATDRSGPTVPTGRARAAAASG